MNDTTSPPPSPDWSSTTKLVVGLTLVAILVAFLIYFRFIIGPLLVAIILAYALHPVAARLDRSSLLSWRWSVNIVFLIFVLVLLAILALSGFAIVQQMQSLVSLVNNFTRTIPDLIERLSSQTYYIGPYQFRLSQTDLESLANQVLNTLQPALGRVGSIISTFAASAVTTMGWGLFILVISYFLLARTREVSDELINLDIPGYSADVNKLSYELRRIWNVFLRGQLVIFLLAIVLYSIMLYALGVRYALGIAMLAGLARFIPYVGPFIVWITTALVAFFQASNYFGMAAWQYAVLVVGLCLVLDALLDNIVVPRFHGDTLGLHPAAVLIAALVAAQLIGLVGLVLAAPVLASMVLFIRYFTRKMIDQDPWPPSDEESRENDISWSEFISRIWGRRQKSKSQE